MRQKQKKNIFITSLIAAILLVIYGGLVGANALKSRDQIPLTLYTIPESDVTAIEFARKETKIRLMRSGEAWVVQGDEGFPLNQNFVETMLKKISRPTAKRYVGDETEKRELYGLNTPSVTIAVEAGGERKIIYLGNQNETTGDYYMISEGSERVYTVDATFGQLFSTDLDQMAIGETLPDTKLENLTGIRIQAEAVKTDFIKREGKWTVNQGDESRICEDDSKLLPLVSDLVRIRFGDMVSYQPDAQTLEKYGFNQPVVTIELTYDQAEKSLYRLWISDMGGEDAYYAYAEGGYGIYQIDAELLKPFLQIDVKEY